MGRGTAASKRTRERITFRKGGEGGFWGLKKKKTFGGFCLLDNYILPAGFCKTRSFVAATTVSEDYGWYNMSEQG